MRVGTPKDVAEYLHVSVDEIYRQYQRNNLPALPRDGIRIRFDMDVIEATFPNPVFRCIGDVYFIQGIDGGPIKIGMTTDLKRRLYDFQHGSPVKLVVLAVLKGGGEMREASIHRRFQRSRLHGEWFEPTSELLDLIEAAKQVAAA